MVHADYFVIQVWQFGSNLKRSSPTFVELKTLSGLPGRVAQIDYVL